MGKSAPLGGDLEHVGLNMLRFILIQPNYKYTDIYCTPILLDARDRNTNKECPAHTVQMEVRHVK